MSLGGREHAAQKYRGFGLAASQIFVFVLLNAWAAYAQGPDLETIRSHISSPNPESRPRAMSAFAKSTVARQSNEQGRCGTARTPIHRHRMLL